MFYWFLYIGYSRLLWKFFLEASKLYYFSSLLVNLPVHVPICIVIKKKQQQKINIGDFYLLKANMTNYKFPVLWVGSRSQLAMD